MAIYPKTILTALAVLMLTSAAIAGPKLDDVAERIVKQSLNVQPGEIVLINGNATEIELMGAMQVAVAKAGGETILQVGIPEANKRAVMETPMEYLGQLRTGQLTLLRMADAIINVASIADPGLFADVPEERLAATRRAAAPLNAAFSNASVRSVTLGQTGGIPTEAYAKSIGANPKELDTMFWKAVAVEPDELSMTARKIAGMLQPGATARLTSKAGTDLTFNIDDTPARINAGRVADVESDHGGAAVWLPAGEAYTCLDSASASGTLVVPQTMFRGVKVDNLKMSFENGAMTKLSADSNEKMLKDYFAASNAQTGQISAMSIGLNNASQPLKGAQFFSWEMGGMVTIGLGSNGWAGGDNAGDGAFTAHLTGTTLEIGNTKVVSDGTLARVR